MDRPRSRTRPRSCHGPIMVKTRLGLIGPGLAPIGHQPYDRICGKLPTLKMVDERLIPIEDHVYFLMFIFNCGIIYL